MAELLELAAAPAQAARGDGETLLPAERRLRAEWRLLGQLAALNPGRLTELHADDMTFQATLRATPGLAADGSSERNQHALRVVFPRYFPAVPLELYLEQPVFHPNVHPETGFVCLWNTHAASHTVEHALHKLVAMLGWRLFNLESRHVMQPDAAAAGKEGSARLAEKLQAAPLTGVDHSEWQGVPAAGTAARRRRLL